MVGIPLIEAHRRHDFTSYPMTDDVHFTPRGSSS